MKEYIAFDMLVALDGLSVQIREFEQRLEELVEVTPEMQWLETLPGVGVILAATIALEVGDVRRFATAERLASYAGTTPRVHSSGDRTRYGRTRPDVNRYLKWAFAEAGNSVAVNHRSCPDRHVSQLYFRLRQRKVSTHCAGVDPAGRQKQTEKKSRIMVSALGAGALDDRRRGTSTASRSSAPGAPSGQPAHCPWRFRCLHTSADRALRSGRRPRALALT